MQGVKQSVCPSVVVVVVVVVVGTKIVVSRLLGIYACYKHNQSIDIGEKLVYMHFKLLKRVTSATNRAFSVQHAYDLSTTPTLFAYYADAIAHAQAQCWKGLSSHKTALLQSMEGSCGSRISRRGVLIYCCARSARKFLEATPTFWLNHAHSARFLY